MLCISLVLFYINVFSLFIVFLTPSRQTAVRAVLWAANKLTSYMYLQVKALCLVPGLPAGRYIQWMSNI